MQEPPIFEHISRYDALTGVPSIQRTVAFEKVCISKFHFYIGIKHSCNLSCGIWYQASVLFNLAALHTQIGSKQDRLLNSESADAAVDNFLVRYVVCAIFINTLFHSSVIVLMKSKIIKYKFVNLACGRNPSLHWRTFYAPTVLRPRPAHFGRINSSFPGTIFTIFCDMSAFCFTTIVPFSDFKSE